MSQPTNPPPPPINPYDVPEPRRPGMSGTSKVLLGLGVGCGALLLICCGVAGIGGYYAYNLAKNAMSTDPDTIREVTNEIVTITIPESFEPQSSMDLNLPFNQGQMQAVVYNDNAVQGVLMLFQFGNAAMVNDPNLRQQFDNSLSANKKFQHEHLQIEESEKFETTINHEPATFTIAQGTIADAEGKFWRVTGDFRGKGGFAQLMLNAKSPDVTKEQIMEILQSMK
jgi:hypothetical protein